jgi:hypothetical protein
VSIQVEGAVCEFCYRQHGDMEPSWQYYTPFWVCPDCFLRLVNLFGAQWKIRAAHGCFADHRQDPRIDRIYAQGAKMNERGWGGGRIDFGLAELGAYLGLPKSIKSDPATWDNPARDALNRSWFWDGIPIRYSPFVAADTMLLYGGREPGKTVVIFKDMYAQRNWIFQVRMRQRYRDIDLSLSNARVVMHKKLQQLQDGVVLALEYEKARLTGELRAIARERRDDVGVR